MTDQVRDLPLAAQLERDDDLAVIMGTSIAELRSGLVLVGGSDFHLAGKHSQKTHGHGGSGEIHGQFGEVLPPDMARLGGQTHDALHGQYGGGFASVGPYEGNDPMTLAEMREGGHLKIGTPTKSWEKELRLQEEDGWFAPGTGRMEGLLTHEYGHHLMHDPSNKTGGQTDQQVRRAAEVAHDHALSKGGPFGLFTSDYSFEGHTMQERDAELFAGFHWGGNDRPLWIREWGAALHGELGLDGTPLREQI